MSWPIAIISLGTIFLLLFRQSINKFLGRVREVGPTGMRTGPEYPKTTLEPSLEHVVDDAVKASSNPTIIEYEKSIRKDLEALKRTDESKQIKILVSALATTQVTLYYEQIFNSIWRSQLSLLRHLNSISNGETLEELRTFYDQGASIRPEVYANYSFERYIDYLTVHKLMEKHDNLYWITQVGIDFLAHLVKLGKKDPIHY